MVPQRLSVKFFVKSNGPVDLAPFTPLFHRWIQNEVVEGLLVDVADYKHVPDGPGVILIGHDVDYAMDLTGGRPGLLVRRKRYQGRVGFEEILRDTIRKAIHAAKAIEADATVGVKLSAASMEITMIDRLVAPNDEQTVAAAAAQIEPLLTEVYEEGLEIRRGSSDARACLSLVATSKAQVDFDELLDRLEAKAASA